jgi:large subunit ribosomal protein L15
MQLHQLQRAHKNKKSVRVGRGGKRGKTSGRGMKGQKSRAGNSMRPEMRDMIKKLPKLRGHGNNRARTVNSSAQKAVPVNLALLEESFGDNETVSPATLYEKKVIGKKERQHQTVKILGQGTLSKKLKISNCSISTKARDAVLKVGGSVA